jgi:hypothetical protein
MNALVELYHDIMGWFDSAFMYLSSLLQMMAKCLYSTYTDDSASTIFMMMDACMGPQYARLTMDST